MRRPYPSATHPSPPVDNPHSHVPAVSAADRFHGIPDAGVRAGHRTSRRRPPRTPRRTERPTGHQWRPRPGTPDAVSARVDREREPHRRIRPITRLRHRSAPVPLLTSLSPGPSPPPAAIRTPPVRRGPLPRRVRTRRCRPSTGTSGRRTPGSRRARVAAAVPGALFEGRAERAGEPSKPSAKRSAAAPPSTRRSCGSRHEGAGPAGTPRSARTEGRSSVVRSAPATRSRAPVVPGTPVDEHVGEVPAGPGRPGRRGPPRRHGVLPVPARARGRLTAPPGPGPSPHPVLKTTPQTREAPRAHEKGPPPGLSSWWRPCLLWCARGELNPHALAGTGT